MVPTPPVLLQRLTRGLALWSTLVALSCGPTAARTPEPAAAASPKADALDRLEAEVGRRTDQALLAEVKELELAPLKAYVSKVLASVASRANAAPSHFTVRVLDSSHVSIRSGPGGYVYVTRGLLAFLGSEAELAGALAHEVAHVARRHWREKLDLLESKGIENGDVGGLSAEDRVELFALMRENELEADRLAVGYLERAGYATTGLSRVIELFAAIERQAGGNRAPPLLRTHPESAARLAALRTLHATGGAERRAEYLGRIDGLVFGEDPRHGFLFGELYVNPSADIELPLPKPWRARLIGRDLLAALPGANSVAVFSRSEHGDLASTRAALGTAGMSFEPRPVAGRSAFVARREETGALTTFSAILQGESGVFVLALVAPSGPPGEARFESLLESARSIESPELRNLPPLRIRLSTLDGESTLREHSLRSPSKTNLETLCLLNGVSADQKLPKGTVVKRVDQ